MLTGLRSVDVPGPSEECQYSNKYETRICLCFLAVATLLSEIALIASEGIWKLALIGKDRSVNVPNRLMQFSCTDSCSGNQWTYSVLADTSGITYTDQGICGFLGTSAIGPLSLVPGGFSFGLYPHWACGTAPVEITDSDGNVYLNFSADIRFFEIAAFGLAD